MTINGRLLLLVVTTGLFVRVWTANDRAPQRNSSRTGRQVVHLVSTSSPVAFRSISTTTRSTPSLEETWTSASCPIPLPAAIQSGIYRVINDAGRVARLEIAPPVATANNASLRPILPEFYVITIGSQRWYFVRLQIPNDQRQVVPAPEAQHDNLAQIPMASSTVSPCSNRKFDFTGYVATDGMKESTGGYVDLPEPPDLPLSR